MARPYTITRVVDIAANDVENNLLAGIEGEFVPEASKVAIAANMEAAGVEMQVTIGPAQVFPLGPVNVSAALGGLPSTRDDTIIKTGGMNGERITVKGVNSTAGALELRVVVVVTPIGDLALQTD